MSNELSVRIYEVKEGKLTKIKVKYSGKSKILDTKESDPKEFIKDKEEFIKSLKFIIKYLPLLDEVNVVGKDTKVCTEFKCCNQNFSSYNELLDHVMKNIEFHERINVIIGHKRIGDKDIPILYQVAQKILENEVIDYKKVKEIIYGIDDQTAQAYLIFLSDEKKLLEPIEGPETFPGERKYKRIKTLNECDFMKIAEKDHDYSLPRCPRCGGEMCYNPATGQPRTFSGELKPRLICYNCGYRSS